jgi:lipoprotein-anchoring transpeptidase ErfK/SrfK
MIGHSTTRNMLASAALAFVVIAPMAPTSANAQGMSWLWGGGGQVGGSGKEVVRFGVQHRPGQIIVSFSDRRLYLVTKPGEALSYPIAVPRDQSRWQGTLSVSSKRVDPPWTPTPAMLRENPKLPAHVPGGHPMNPMGARALYLGATMYRIHGTDAPWSIGQAVSKGCIRMYNKDVIDLYDRVPTGTRVTVTWNRYQSGPAVASGSSPAPTNSSSQQTSDYNAFTFPWFDSQRAEPPRRAQHTKQRAVQKRRPPRSAGSVPGKQVKAPDRVAPMTVSVAAPQQAENAH